MEYRGVPDAGVGEGFLLPCAACAGADETCPMAGDMGALGTCHVVSTGIPALPSQQQSQCICAALLSLLLEDAPDWPGADLRNFFFSARKDPAQS